MQILSVSLHRTAVTARLANLRLMSIAAGTDLSKSSVSWQKARPWYSDDDEGSNLAADNAVGMDDLFKGRKVAVFGVPAPFTGVCTHSHVPPYKKLEADFRAKGVDELVCYTVADPYSHYNWAKAMNVDTDKITFLADVDCEWAKENDLDRDYKAASLGVRSARFSMIVEDGKVKSFNIVEDAEKDADTLLEQV